MPAAAPIVTSDHQATAGEFVRASGTLIVSLPLGAEAGGSVTVQQVGSGGTVTLAGIINGSSEGATITGRNAALTVEALGDGTWVTVSDTNPATQSGRPDASFAAAIVFGA